MERAPTRLRLDWEDALLGVLSTLVSAFVQSDIEGAVEPAAGMLGFHPLGGVVLVVGACSGLTSLWLVPPSFQSGDGSHAMKVALGALSSAILAAFGAMMLGGAFGPRVAILGPTFGAFLTLPLAIGAAYIRGPTVSATTRRRVAFPLEFAGLSLFVALVAAMREGASSADDGWLVLVAMPFMFPVYLYTVVGGRLLAGHTSTWPARILGFVWISACTLLGLEVFF